MHCFIVYYCCLVCQGLARRLDVPTLVPRALAHKAAAALPDHPVRNRHKEDVEAEFSNVHKPHRKQQQHGQGCQPDQTLAVKTEIGKKKNVQKKNVKGQGLADAPKGQGASPQAAQRQHVISPMVRLASPATALGAASEARE